jgi:hypothetical protein
VTATERDGCALIYDLAPKQPVRLILQVGDVCRAPLWLMVGKDASVYVGLPRATAWAKHRQKQAVAGGTVEVKYVEGEYVSNRELLKSLHLSFHPSGAINLAGKRNSIPEWRELKKARQLCLILFETIEAYPTALAVRKRDIPVNYKPELNHPLVARLLIAPPNSPVIVNGQASSQLIVAFDITTTAAPSAFRLQIALFEGPTGNPPPATYVVCAAGEAWRESEGKR